MFAADVDGDGRIDALSASVGDDTIAWYPNQGGQFSLAVTDTAPAGAMNGAVVAMLRIDASHRGQPGDGDLELATLGLLFEESAADPLTTAEANALVESVRVYRDANGNGVFDLATDSLVAFVPILSLSGGVQTVVFGDGDPSVQEAAGASVSYFAVVELTADASMQSPNQFRVTHLALGPLASRAEDRTYDIPLQAACPSDVTSRVVSLFTSLADLHVTQTDTPIP